MDVNSRPNRNETLANAAQSKATPQKIPRPPNAFMIFANEWRKKLAMQNPRESNKEISVRLGGMWKNMVKEVKDKYFSLARQVDAEHKRKYPDYVYNPKEARIRKAMRDQASRARAVNQQHQRQHHQHQQHQNQQHHHHQAQSRQQYVMQMGGRNDIISRARLNSLPRQTQSSNVQQNHKISHLRIPPHILQQKPNQIHIQQVSQGICNETCGQQWMAGMEQRHGIHHPHQQEFAHSQEQHYEKTKASIRQQVEQGLLDGVYGNFTEMETATYPTSRVVEVTGSGCSDGFSNRSGSEDRTGMGPHVTIPNGQEFTVYTDGDGRQHWYPYAQADEIKVLNGGVNNWNQQHEQQVLRQMPHHHMHNENHDLKMTGEHQQLFPSQFLVGQESSNPLQVSPGDVGSQGEEYSQVQQYVICPPSAPQAKFIAQMKVEVEDTKENPNEIEISETSPSVMISSTANATSSNLEELEQRNPDSLPLPAFQQAFGSTEIGRFANEGFLSQSPEAPNWSDPSSPFGLSSPQHTSNPTAAYYLSPPSSEEVPNHTITFPQSLNNYFDLGMLEEIDGLAGGYGDLVGLVGSEGSGFDFLTLHVPPVEYTEKDGEANTCTGVEEMNIGLMNQESSDLLFLAQRNPDDP